MTSSASASPASGFLHHMVRNIVGTLVEIGRGSLEPSDLTRILNARDRTAAGPTAPARGLYLVEVIYDSQSTQHQGRPIHDVDEVSVMGGVPNAPDHQRSGVEDLKFTNDEVTR